MADFVDPFAEKSGLFGADSPVKEREFVDPFAPKEDKSTLSALGRTLLRVPENLVAQGIGAVQGQTGASVADAGPMDKFYNRVQKRNEKLAQEYAGAGDTIIPGVSKQDVAQLGPNLAFSGISMGASLAGSLPGGGPMSPVGIVGGMAAGGAAAYRMQSYQTMNEWLNRKNEESLQQFGRSIDPIAEKAFRAKFEALATEGGLWEAGPESVGNVLELALMAGKGTLPGRILGMIPDGIKGKLIKGAGRMAGIIGTEEATETVTQMGQHNVEVKAGMSDEPMRSWTSGDDWLKSAQEVLPAVLLLSGFMGAGGAMYRRYKANTDNELGQKIDEAMEGMPDQNAAIQTKPSEFDTPIGAETTAVNPVVEGQTPVVDQSQPVVGEAPPVVDQGIDQTAATPVFGQTAIDPVAATFPVNSKIVDENGNSGTVTGHKASETGTKIQVTWDNAKPGQLPLVVDPGKISLLTETPAEEIKQPDIEVKENPPEENAVATPEPTEDKQVITPEAPPAGPVAAAKKSVHQMTTDEYIQDQFDALDDQTKAEVLADKQAAADLENKWTVEHIAEVISAQQRGETIPPEVMDGIKAKIPVTETGIDKAQPPVVEPGASSQEGAGKPATIDLQGKRSWYDFKDLKNSELNDEEAKRVMLDTGPTPEETAEWNARQGEAGKRQAAAAAKEAEEIKRQGEVMRRSQEGRAKGAPEMHIKEVARRIDGIRATKGNTHKVSVYAQHFADAVGVPNKYEFLAKIADKLGITVHITDAYSAAPPTDQKTDGSYNIDTGIITISPRAMAQALDLGPGYGIAHGWELITHEILHGVARKSAKYASARKRLLEFRNSLTPYMANAPSEMVGLMNHIDRYDIDEMVSEAFTNQTFAQWLDSIPAEGVKNPSKTFWGKLKDIIMKSLETFGLPKSKLSELNEIMDQVLPVEMAEEKTPAPPENKPPAPPEIKPPPEVKENQYGTPEKINTVELSNLLSQHIDATYGKIDKTMVKGWVAEAFGLTDQELNALEKINRYDHKAVEEAFEYAIVRAARMEIARDGGRNPNNLINRFIEMYNNQPNLASRTSESTIMQQYSTPLPIAWLMNKFLGLTGKAEITVYEPTAGNGMLLIGARAKDVTANELDKGARLAHLRDLIDRYGGKVSNKDAKDWTPGSKTQDRVVANPPFGASPNKSVDGYQLSKLEHQIIAEALGAMKDNGKAAFIIGGHNIKDTGRITGTDQIFFNWLYNHYNVTHNIDINGDLYARQGTKFPVRLITIEGRKATPDTGIANYTGIEPAETFYDIRDILDRRADEKPAGGEAENTGKEGNGPGPEGEPGGEPDAQGAGGNGSGEPGRGGNKLPGRTGNGPKPGGGRTEQPGDKREGDDGVQPKEPATGRRGPVPDDGMGGPDVSGNAEQGGDVPNGKAGEKSSGVKDDYEKAVDDLIDLFMPYEENKKETFDEAKYEKITPALQTMTEEAVSKFGEDVTLADIRDDLKEKFEAKKPGSFLNAFPYIFKFLRAKLDTIVEAFKSGMQYQKKYAPRSKGPSGNTLIPKNQEQAVQEALNKIEAAHGNIDQWVMNELKYASTDALYKAFSAEQIDALAMAIDNIGTNNAGFILGDQTGVGKGRVVAGMIRYANVNGKIPVFVTAQSNLFTDMYRDLTGIDHRIKPFIMNNHDKDRPANITDQATGEVIHYADRDGEVKNKKEDIRAMTADPEKFLRDNDYKALFTTYSQHNQKNYTVKDNIIAALSKDNIIIIDESHEAAGASKIDPRKGPSNTNRKFIGFLNEASGVLYSSATYAKSPANMVLYFRTVLGDAGISMKDLLRTIEDGGVPFQEYLSNIIARMGQYVRRELDFSGINYNRTLTMDKAAKGSPEAAQLKKEFEEHKKIADATNERVMDIKEFDRVLKGRYLQELIRLLTDKFGVVMGRLPDRFNPSITMFTSLLHNVEQQLLSSIKVEKTLEEAKLSLDKGQKVIIAVDNTMESFLDDVMDKNKLKVGDPVDFRFKAVLERALNNCLKFSAKDHHGNKVYVRLTIQDLEEEIPEAAHLFKEVMARIQQYNQNLHASPIDYLRSELQKHSKKPVYELTGRHMRVDYDGEGGQKRIAERKDPNKNKIIGDFNNGSCDVIIINKSGSTGLSLHTDPQFKDKRQRKMIIHQADRDINVFMQVLGRVNRKGQVNVPEYLDIITSLPAELRPATVRERKLASLKANTTSSQEGAERSKETPDMMNVYGNRVTRDYLAKNPELAMSIGLIQSERDDIPQDDSSSYAKVSGKIAVLPVEAQKEFFDDIESMYNSLIEEVNARGENELISKDYDFQARMIEKRMLVRDTFAGANANPILDAVHIEKMQVRMLNKPHNTAKLTQLITDALGIKTEKKTANEIQQEIISKREDFANDLKNKIQKAAEEYFQAWQAKLPEKYENPETIAREAQRKQQSMSAELRSIHAAINQFKLGATYSIPVDRDNVDNRYTGVLVNILWGEGAGNPVQPGNTKFVFSLNDPKQTAVNHVGQQWFVQTARKVDTYIPTDWNDDLPQDKHEPEPRYIITGSMLKAYMAIPDGARVEMISFTRDDGKREFGLLVAKKDEEMMWGHRVDDAMQNVRWQEAMEYVTHNQDAGERFVSTVNGLITIKKRAVRLITETGLYENEYMVNVPSSKEGAPYYQDRDLMALVRGGNFRKQSSRMMAVVEPANIAEFLRLLQEKHDITYRIPYENKHMPYEAAGENKGKDNIVFAPYIPAALQDKMDKMTDAILSRPQSIIPKDALDKVRSELKSQENFKVIDKYFGLPWWNAQKYPVWQKAFEIFGIKRPEMRGNLMHQFASLAEPFLKLDANMRAEGFKPTQIADAKSRIQKIIVAGDALLGKEYRDLKRQVKIEEKQPTPDKAKIAEWKARINQIETLNRYSDEELREGVKNEYGELVKLNNREIEVYTRVRAALDNMFDTYHAHLQAQAFRTYQKNKWYAILCQAAGADLTSDATAKLIGSGLRGAALTYAQRIQVDIQGIFERVDKNIEETSDIEKKAIGEIYGVIANRMTADVKRLREHLGKVTGLQGEELTDATKQILAAYVKTKPEMKRIKSLRNLYKKQIAFFPRVREQGKYKLHLVEHIYDDDGNLLKDRKIHSEMFSNEAEYKALYANYMTKYAKSGKLPDNYEIMAPEMVIKTPETAFQGVNDINMQKILDDAIDNMKMKDGNWAEKLRNAGYQAIAGQFQSRGWGSHLKHRQWNVVKGYEEQDLQKVLFNYLSGMSGIMTKQVAGAEFLEMMKDVKNPTMFEGLSKYGKDQLRNSNQMDKISQKARGFMFTWYLGGILRPAAVQLTQNFVTGIPEYAKYLRKNNLGGSGKADMLYMKAMKDIASGKMNNNKNLTPQEQRMQRELLTDGVTQDQYIKAIFEGLGDKFDQTYNKAMKWLAMPFSFMEMYNRQAAALTMFRTAYKLALKEEGATEETAYQKAFDKAREFVYNTHYAMDKANLPQLTQGGDFTSVALKTAYTFRSFTHNYALWMKNNLTSGDWRTTMHSLAYMAMFGGLMGLPLLKDLFEWAEKQFGYSPATTVRTALRGIGGKTLETFGFSGLPAVLGMNISGSLALGIPGMGETPLDSVYGVYGGMATKIGRAVDAAGRGDLYRVSANLAPEFMRNPIVAMMESGVGKSMGAPGYSTTTRGRAIYGEQGKPIQMTAGQAAVKFTGFNPTGNAREKEQNQVIKRQEEWGQEAKRDLSETYRIEKTNRDPKAMQHLMAGVKKLNQKIKDRGIQQIVPLVNVSTVIRNSREKMTKKQRKEVAYKQAAL